MGHDRDAKKRWPHTEMPIVGRTMDGYRIARMSDGREKILAPGQEAIEFHYNGPSLAELHNMNKQAGDLNWKEMGYREWRSLKAKLAAVTKRLRRDGVIP